MAVSNLNRMWVMVPASTGQNSYSSAALGASGAVLEFVRGMRGAADARPWGDADGRVELHELSAYLTLRVDQWARAMLGDRQTPILTSTSSDLNADAALAWTASKTPVVELRSDADVSEDAWLADRWRRPTFVTPGPVCATPLASPAATRKCGATSAWLIVRHCLASSTAIGRNSTNCGWLSRRTMGSGWRKFSASPGRRDVTGQATDVTSITSLVVGMGTRLSGH